METNASFYKLGRVILFIVAVVLVGQTLFAQEQPKHKIKDAERTEMKIVEHSVHLQSFENMNLPEFDRLIPSPNAFRHQHAMAHAPVRKEFLKKERPAAVVFYDLALTPPTPPIVTLPPLSELEVDLSY